MRLPRTSVYKLDVPVFPLPAPAGRTSCTRHRGTRTPHGIGAAPRTVTVHFTEDDICIEAQPKENIVEVAERAGVSIETGCNSGSCGICEVEVRKFGEGAIEASGAPAVVRACIAAVPPGYSRIEIAPLNDKIWGSDGWDT